MVQHLYRKKTVSVLLGCALCTCKDHILLIKLCLKIDDQLNCVKRQKGQGAVEEPQVPQAKNIIWF
jgi:hypothetical protein